MDLLIIAIGAIAVLVLIGGAKALASHIVLGHDELPGSEFLNTPAGAGDSRAPDGDPLGASHEPPGGRRPRT